ncbi:major capsid protein [Ectopseudomonas composti]|uniref:major capsid protein n=1 Tax=Ectopseudomonas composti TaxID=658457 RepID=UPI000774AA8E|nr:major capsid protein [Pseudomonas composti]
MAAGKASDFKVYQDQFQAGIVETLTQNSNAFNAASAGAISLSTLSRRGDYSQQAFFKNVANLITRRDTTSVSDATILGMAQDEWISVKLNRKIGPVDQTKDAFRKIMAGLAEDEMSFLLGEMAAKAMQVEMLNSALRAGRAALNAQSAVKHTIATNGTLNTAGLVTGLSKFGDAAGQIVCWVMHSKQYYDLVQAQITANIDGVSNFNVATGTPVTLNRPVLVTDSDALVVTAGSGSAATTDYFALGLTADALIVENTEEEELVIENVTGKENLITRMQGEFAYNLGVKGFKWDIANGGANPSDATLGTGSNWDAVRGSYKDFAGVVIQSR